MVLVRTLISSNSVNPLQHLAIIPDGNRRWARRRGLLPADGHRHGFLEVTPHLLRSAWELFHIKEITLWVFSYDNWQRPKDEVEPLMGIYIEFIHMLKKMPLARDLQVSHLGRKDRIPPALCHSLVELEEKPCSEEAFKLNLALDYGGLEGLKDSLKLLSRLDDSEMPYVLDQQLSKAPDLILRTSGERRLSGFMPLYSSLSELHFVDTLYPDMTEEKLKTIVDDYYVREQKRGC